MRSRHALTAALALSVVTILTVAACGSSVQGAAQVNSAAAETMTSAESSTTSSARTTRPTVEDTELSDLSSMLNDLSTVSVPTDFPTDLTFPTDFSDLNIPGYSNACISVSLAYLSVTLAPLSTLAGGSSQYDASELKKALEDLRNSGEIPPEIAPDIDTLAQLADQSGSGSLSDAAQLFQSPDFVTASDHISAWLDTNCSGG
ncbi:hypothetical protein [Nakamurella multipartita]|jgi:hypothetical protein|uniref:Lipoprotein n=1 Tax=Nakamurella multipartita (strain ATCC 700099 / DSM 44233 / CIP 104796 / JCM 9543 / NBRC 105858 / Y-104) TaxID=479431 RepID=C8XGR0_NAKMY|nr:hypothetical protein [Nakamurella multipartita]ACV78243.1 hypothetical protein Namu_1854 [Nakamurella multipartita DSM 44233]HOZ57514.1 hypothetical protein [Nakamurella multipartita]